jgi:allophanate hydrolase subunit 1
MTDESRNALAKAIAAELPEAVIESIVSEAINSMLIHFRYSEADIQKVVQDTIVEHARALLKTKYATEVDKQADVLAARMVGEMASFAPRAR